MSIELKKNIHKIFFIFSIICFLFIEQNGIKKALLNLVFSSCLLIYFYKKNLLKIKLKGFKVNSLFYISLLFAIFHILEVMVSFYNSLKHGMYLKKILDTLFKNYSNDYKMILLCVTVTLGILSIYGIFILWFNFLNFIFPIIISFFKSMKQYERNFLMIFSILFFGIVLFSFYKTNIFYFPNNGKLQFYDIIFSSDSGAQYFTNVFLNILAPENDIRQPLFGLFSLPFSIIAYILSFVFFFIEDSYAFFLMILNLFLIGITGIFISRMLPINKDKEKIIFLFYYSTLYPVFLFNLLIEQYVIAVFYLILFLYLFINKIKYEEFVFIGAIGTLITSCIIGINYINLRKIKESFFKIKKISFLFINFIILVGYSNILLTSASNIIRLYNGFGGEKVLFFNKLKQYFSFIVNCFIAPQIIYTENYFKAFSLQLDLIEKINIIGLTLFFSCLISFFFYKKNKFVFNCFIWILFSFFLFCVVGWGTIENGLILYSYYFSWAFSSLIFLFLRKILKNDYIFYMIICIIIFYLIYRNSIGIMEIINFGIKNYPKI